MKRGDIYVVDLEPTAGKEQRGKRPVIVISPAAFNKVTALPLICPITTEGGFARTAGFAVPLMGFGLQTTGVVRCDQVRVLDIAERKGRFIEAAAPAIVNQCLMILQAILE